MNRNWLITRNNPEVGAEDYLTKFHQEVKARYTVGQLEKGAEGTIHIQFFCNFEKPVRCSHLTKVDKKIHCEKVKVNNGADTYCMKEDTRLEGPWEFGEKPLKRNDKKDWEEIKEKAKAGKLDDLPADIYVQHYRTLK